MRGRMAALAVLSAPLALRSRHPHSSTNLHRCGYTWPRTQGILKLVFPLVIGVLGTTSWEVWPELAGPITSFGAWIPAANLRPARESRSWWKKKKNTAREWRASWLVQREGREANDTTKYEMGRRTKHSPPRKKLSFPHHCRHHGDALSNWVIAHHHQPSRSSHESSLKCLLI